MNPERHDELLEVFRAYAGIKQLLTTLANAKPDANGATPHMTLEPRAVRQMRKLKILRIEEIPEGEVNMLDIIELIALRFKDFSNKQKKSVDELFFGLNKVFLEHVREASPH